MKLPLWLLITTGAHILTISALTLAQTIYLPFSHSVTVELSQELIETKPIQNGIRQKSKTAKDYTDNTNHTSVNKKEESQNNPEHKNDGTTDTQFAFARDAEMPPVPLTRIAPRYPDDARRLGLEGLVVLELFIDENGLLRKTVVLKSPHSLLSEAAIRSVIEARFRPARIAGKDHAVRMPLALRFVLNGL